MAASILCYGDSNTAGFHSGGQGYAPYAASLTSQLAQCGWSCQVEHDGLSGLTASEMVGRASSSDIRDVAGLSHKGLALHLRKRPDIVIIMAGTNDLGKGASPEEIVGKVADLHQMCHAAGVSTVAVAPPTVASGPLRQKRNRLAQLLQQWAQSRKGSVLQYVDAEDVLPRSASHLWEPDQFHFSPDGSTELGRQLARQLLPCLEQLPGCTENDYDMMQLKNASCAVNASWLEGMLSAFVGPQF